MSDVGDPTQLDTPAVPGPDPAATPPEGTPVTPGGDPTGDLHVAVPPQPPPPGGGDGYGGGGDGSGPGPEEGGAPPW